MSNLIQAVHKTQEYFLMSLSKDIYEENGVTAFAPGIGDPNINFAMQTSKIEGDLDKIIQNVEKFYDGFHLSWGWMINPSRDQAALKAALEKRGYKLTGSYPVFTFSLKPPLPLDDIKKFDVKEVGKKELKDWILPQQDAFQATEADALNYLNMHEIALQKKANFRHFVAYNDGVPVSAGTLSLSAHGARIDDIGTEPDFQRKGLGTALTLYAMRVAKELGYPWVCLEASDKGVLLYKSMGFKQIYQNEIYGRNEA
ncbi:MAG TPA: GNAT family N-acetyltransferase [Alphaproteobacteria bacterium]|nr:GNAT family N-acetyltransferase [Alphaproteobacteria bacterium]